MILKKKNLWSFIIGCTEVYLLVLKDEKDIKTKLSLRKIIKLIFSLLEGASLQSKNRFTY